MKRLPELVLVVVTAIWGGTFLATRTALQGTGPFTLLFVRFTLGALAVGLFVRKRPSSRQLGAGLLIGLVTAIAIGSQTIGLRTVESARAAFLTALYVPLVPLLQGPLTGARPGRPAALGAGLAFVGLTLLSLDGGLSLRFGLGEALMLVGALASALQIILVGRFAAEGDASATTAIQLASVAMLTLSGGATEGLHMTPMALGLAAGLGLLATAGALYAMNWAQRSVSPTKATLLYALEPVWAAAFGLMAGEALSVLAAVGGGLVVTGALVGELLPDRRSATA